MSATDSMENIILVPTYNERDNIAVLLPKIFAVSPSSAVMVIDDQSPDGTADVVRDLCRRYPRLSLFERKKKEGLGRAYADALIHILPDQTIEAVLLMDADLSHDPASIPFLLHELEHADVVIGSRYVPGGTIVGWEWVRRILSAWGNRYCRWVTGLPVHDQTSGFYAMRASLLRQLSFSHADPSGYAFQVHLKYQLWKLGARIIEYPITFRNRVTGESKISVRIIEEGIFLPWRLLREEKESSTTVNTPSHHSKP